MQCITKVLKFGGTSVGSPGAIRRAHQIVQNAATSENPLIVVSAFSGITDSLIQLYSTYAMGAEYQTLCNAIFTRHLHACRELGLPTPDLILSLQAEFEAHLDSAPPFTAAFRDKLLSFGERLSSSIIASFFTANGLPSYSFDAREVVVTDDHYGMAKVDFPETFERIKCVFSNRPGIPIVTGFIGSNRHGGTTTLGRGGSDFTASIFGAALNVREIEIWTDVNGICTADPNLDASAQTLPIVSYEQALSLSLAGAKVIHAAAIPPALQAGIPIKVKNSFEPEHPGTVICALKKTHPDNLKPSNTSC